MRRALTLLVVAVLVLSGNLLPAAEWGDLKLTFVYDGAIPIDNGAVERAIRPVKLGAKNWLFAASEVGAEVVGVFYTLINSALMNGIHPYYYLMDLTKRIDLLCSYFADTVSVELPENLKKQAG